MGKYTDLKRKAEAVRDENSNWQPTQATWEYHDALRDPSVVLRLINELEKLQSLKLPDYLQLSAEMREAGEHAEKRAIEDQCYSVPVLKGVFFEAAIQRWLNDTQDALELLPC